MLWRLFPLYQKKDFYSMLCAYLTVALVMNLSKDAFEPNIFPVVASVQKALNKIKYIKLLIKEIEPD